MDMDMNNQHALQAGIHFHLSGAAEIGWSPMSDAPRDGTPIEIRCTYGAAPWYGLFSWEDGRWGRMGNRSSGFDEGASFSWRPYQGDPAVYRDPTGGMQDSPAYWRAAVATKYGLSPDYFEKGASQKAESKSFFGFWKWLFVRRRD